MEDVQSRMNKRVYPAKNEEEMEMERR